MWVKNWGFWSKNPIDGILGINTTNKQLLQMKVRWSLKRNVTWLLGSVWGPTHMIESISRIDLHLLWQNRSIDRNEL